MIRRGSPAAWQSMVWKRRADRMPNHSLRSPRFPRSAGDGREGRTRPGRQTHRSMTKRFFTPEEVAELLRVTPAAIQRLLRRGDIPAARVGRAWRQEDEGAQRW